MAKQKTPAAALAEREQRRAQKAVRSEKPAPLVVSKRAKRQEEKAALAPNASERAGNLVIDLFMCVCFTAATVAAIFELTGFQTDLWYVLLLSAAGTGLILLFAWKWWIPVGLLALGTGVVFLIVWIQDNFRMFFLYWEGFGDWIYSGMAKVEPYTSNGSVLLVAFLLVLPAALVFYLFCRKLFSFWVTLILVIGATAALEFTENAQAVPALCLMLCGLLLALPGVVTRIANRGKSGEQRISRHAMQLVAIPLTVICVFLGWALGPHENGIWKNQSLNYLVSDIRDYVTYLTGNGENGGSTFSMRSTGFQPLGSRLGGDIAIKNYMALTADTDTPILLAGAIGDTYDGKTWSDGFDTGRFRYQSIFWRGYRNWTYQSELPLGDAYVRRLYNDITVDARLVITTSLRNTNALFASGRIDNITIRNPAIGLTPYFNLQGELFSDQKTSSVYVLETTAFDTSDYEYRDKLVLMEKELTDQNVRDPYLAEVKTRYLGVSDTVEAFVYTLADEILAESITPTNPVDTPITKAFALSDWLSENMTYTITPGDVPEDRDFVSYFLETRQGYCTYYASALAILCRIEGIPTRYVTGFALAHESGKGYVARYNNAHAWVEAYFEGIGWVTLDALGPRDALENYVEPEREQSTVTAPSATPSPTPTPYSGTEEVPKLSESHFSIWVVLIPGAILLLFLAAIVYVSRVRTKYERRYDARKAIFFCLTAERAADYLYDGILHQLRFFELWPQPGETFGMFAERVDDRLRFPSDNQKQKNVRMQQVVQVLMRERYGLKRLSTEDVELLGRYFKQVEQVLKDYLGESGYFWKRACRRLPSAK